MAYLRNNSQKSQSILQALSFLCLVSFVPLSIAEDTIVIESLPKAITNEPSSDIKTLAEQIQPGPWSGRIKESSNISYTCPSGQIMFGRRHYGDENKNTNYQCATVRFGGVSVTFQNYFWSDWIKESSNIAYTCPVNKIMVGHQHSGDENGKTRYQCATASINGTRLAINTNGWSNNYKESSHEYVCASDQVMIGRVHSGDENGATKYRCATIAWGRSPGIEAAKISSNTIRESSSSYTCPDNTVMVGRHHIGDENGNTWYQCADLTINNDLAKVTERFWSDWIKESRSSYACPFNQIMVGREHSGDENGKTRYQCARVVWKGNYVNHFFLLDWSPYFIESHSNFNCPDGTFMIGRRHYGDENGLTQYQCAASGTFNNKGTLSIVHSRIINQVGYPATTSPRDFATQTTMGIDNTYFLQLDIGGEGYGDNYGVESGFQEVININAQKWHSQTKWPIPSLVWVNPWGTNPPYPFANGTVDYLTLQGAPLTNKGVEEFARVIKKGGSVGLWVDPKSPVEGQPMLVNINRLARLLNTTVSDDCADEFVGKAGNSKLCMTDHR